MDKCHKFNLNGGTNMFRHSGVDQKLPRLMFLLFE